MGCLEAQPCPGHPFCSSHSRPTPFLKTGHLSVPRRNHGHQHWVPVYLRPLGTRHGARSLKCIISFKPLNTTVR